MDPAVARAFEATNRALEEVAQEFGLLSEAEVEEQLGGPRTSLEGLLAIQLHGARLYPKFQFDLELRQVKPVIRPLLDLASLHGWTHDGVVLWLTSTTTYLDSGVRPIELLDTEPQRLLRTAEKAWGADW